MHKSVLFNLINPSLAGPFCFANQYFLLIFLLFGLYILALGGGGGGESKDLFQKKQRFKPVSPTKQGSVFKSKDSVLI